MIRGGASLLRRLKKWGAGETLAISQFNLGTLLLAFLLLFGFLTFGELFFRIEAVQARLSTPRLGSRHQQFEQQYMRLKALASRGEPIDCIFLGNSMIWLGVNPLVVDQTFYERTGQEIHCFNFGISALPASSAGLIAPMLVNEFHPKLLIYGTFARDYAIPPEAEDAVVVSEAPWLKVKNGNFNLPGWLYLNSKFLQYQGHLLDLLYFNFGDALNPNFPEYHDYGLDPKLNIRIDVTAPIDYEDIGSKDPIKWLTHYEIQEENLEGLQQVLDQSKSGVEVIVIEMPFHENAYQFFLNEKLDYETYIQQIVKITSTRNIPLWRIADQPDIPTEDWWDYFHFNLQGADFFSEWLGKQLAEETQWENLTLISPDHP